MPKMVYDRLTGQFLNHNHVNRDGDSMDGNLDLGTHQLSVHNIRPDASDGLLIESLTGNDVAIMGANDSQNATFFGNVRVPRVGIGSDVNADYGLNLLITETVNSGEKRGLSFVLTSNPASASNANIYGFLGFADHTSNQNKTGNMAGGYSGARHSGTGSAAVLWGLFGEAQGTNTGAQTEAVGLYGFVSDYGGATYTKAYGLRSLGAFFGTVSDFYSIYAGAAYQTYGSGATVTRNHGLYIEDQYIGVTNYGAYFAGSGINNAINWSGDTNLYRSGANILKTDDSFEIGTNLRFTTGLDNTAVGTTAGRLPVILNGSTYYLQVFNA